MPCKGRFDVGPLKMTLNTFENMLLTRILLEKAEKYM